MPATLKLISSMATREVLNELASRFERDTGQKVATEAAGGVDVAKRVQNGEAVDIVVLASNAIDKLIADGKVLAGSRVDLVQSGVSIAVRKGAAQAGRFLGRGVEARRDEREDGELFDRPERRLSREDVRAMGRAGRHASAHRRAAAWQACGLARCGWHGGARISAAE